MSTELKEFMEGLSAEEVKAILDTKNKISKVDADLLALFGIDPADYALDDLTKLTRAARCAVADGRTTLKLPTYLRLVPQYKLAVENMKTKNGVSLSHLVTAMVEAILTGDIIVERRRTTQAEAKVWGQSHRVLLKDKNGLLLNTTNYKERPDGVKL